MQPKRESLVSVILPTFNRGRIISKAIESIVNQTYSNWELFIVDDGSTDNTADVVKCYTHDSRIKYISYPDRKGANHARNIGLKKASGDYLAFSDSDGYWLPNYLEERLKALKEHAVELVWGRFLGHMDGKEYIEPSLNASLLNSPFFLVNELYKRNHIGTHALVITRKCYEITGGFDESLRRFQDWDLVLKLICEHKIPYYFCDDILDIDFTQDDSITKTEDRFEARFVIFLNHIESCFSNDCFQESLDVFLDYLPVDKENDFLSCIKSRFIDETLCASLSLVRKYKKENDVLKSKVKSIEEAEAWKAEKQNRSHLYVYAKYYMYKILDYATLTKTQRLGKSRRKYHEFVRKIRNSNYNFKKN